MDDARYDVDTIPIKKQKRQATNRYVNRTWEKPKVILT
jgi:hypothetical protein